MNSTGVLLTFKVKPQNEGLEKALLDDITTHEVFDVGFESKTWHFPVVKYSAWMSITPTGGGCKICF